ncbi:hypothetical protein QAD02_014509 [Eretmocerus hayati]|uniref:Uncharacterized protein n=1 Tax=Eretmocerus hayati TaxID=131215 RepID=A0ACC2P5R9_9HYME|nr:hypothetical protein QAD02_014509 [Eretmocerus hayati]
MASRVLCAIVVVISLTGVFTEPESKNGWQDSVPGTPGRDYPNLTSIPRTSFTCAGKTPGGYYADVEARCQVFHVCSTQGSKSSFLCPSGSVFNQRHFVCDWWYDFECERALELYSLNDALNDVSSNSDDDRTDPAQQESPGAPLQSNSIDTGRSGVNSDLSLASSGYANNLRDESNLIYEDYAPSDRPNADAHDWEHHRQPAPTTQNGKTRQDIVPRGFSKRPSDERFGDRDLIRNAQGPGSFVNDGLSGNSEKYWREPHREQNINYNLGSSSDLNGGNHHPVTRNNDNFVRNDFNNGNDRYKSNPEEYPLPQENNNYVDNYHENQFDNQNFKNGVSNNNNAGSFGEGQQNKYSNVQSNYATDRDNYNNYQSQRSSNSNSGNQGENFIRNDYDETKNANYQTNNENNLNEKTNEQYSQPVLVNYVNYHKARTLEDPPRTDEYANQAYPTNYPEQQQYQNQNDYYNTEGPDFPEEEIERAWQREVDRVELRRHHQHHHYHQQQRQQHFSTPYSPAPTPAISESIAAAAQEEPASWRDDLSTSSSGGLSRVPPYPPGGSYVTTLTTPRSTEASSVSTSTIAPSKNQSSGGHKRKPEFLGRRPAGGLPSGSGNGLPGASKVLAGSDSVTGRPLASSTDNGSGVDEQPPLSDEAGYRYDAGRVEGEQSWSDNEAYMLPSPPPAVRRGTGLNPRLDWQTERSLSLHLVMVLESEECLAALERF